MNGRRILVGLALAAAVAFGCSVIVPAELPDFACSGSSASACPSGMVCDTAQGKCVVEAGVIDEDAGDTDAGDGPDATVDADGGPAAVGSPCRVDGDCASLLCGTSTILTTTITSGSGPVCTKTCCTSADCPSGTVCFSGGTGGNYCVAAAKALRTPPATGGKSPGATCSGSPECRSGLCQLGRCLDTCCLVGACSAGTTCRVSTITSPTPAHDSWVCAPPPPGADAGDGQKCVSQSDCKNDNCIGSGLLPPDAGTPEPRACRPSCCNKQDCVTQLGAGSHCAYSTSGTDQIKFCFFTTKTSGLTKNQPCGTNTECQSDYCDAELQKCLEVCCADSDCAANEVCRPSGVSTPFLRCVPSR
jgi:hypothetical protein